VTLAHPEVIDWLGIEKDTGYVVLTIVDDLDWTDEHSHLLALQDKLNRYLAFIESGEVFDRLLEDVKRPVVRDTPIKVSILAKFPPPARAREFIEHAQSTFMDAGFALSFKVLTAGQR
jgi:hypothetical protein